jgi:P-type Cu+ transporter
MKSGTKDALAVTIPVSGMTCASCVSHVERALAKAPGVRDVSVNLATGNAHVLLDGPGEAAGLPEVLARAGYPVRAETARWSITGMTCASCVSHVERVLRAVPGVSAVSVNLATEQASVAYTPGVLAEDAIEAAVARAGYQAARTDRDSATRDAETRQAEYQAAWRQFVLAAILAFPVFILEMGGHLIPGIHDAVARTIGHANSAYLQFALATLVMVWPGRGFYRTGLPNLLRGTPEMNSLVAVGTLAAWGFSVVATFLPSALPAGTGHIYFEASAVIIVLILLGRYLEARSKGRTGAAIRHLIALRPKTAEVVRAGKSLTVAVDDVVVGDLVVIKPGERVPVDGQVVEGASHVDESMITGEPVPVRKTIDSEVVGGTINTTGSFTFRAMRVGSETVLADIVRLVENAQGAKLPIQALVDRVTRVFVPMVLALAALTFLAWMILAPAPALADAIVSAVAVLIIACPCAMGLATPTSIMVGTGRAAELGILFHRGDALQALKNVDIVALDKTGTLTKGHPELTDMIVADGFDRSEAYRVIAALEGRSEHPVARAIVDSARAAGVEIAQADEVESRPGFGIGGIIGGKRVEIGAARHMASLGIGAGALDARADALAAEGKTPLFAAIDGRLAALIAVSDPLKETTPAAIAALRALGLRVVMLTGDARKTATAIAGRLGITEVHAEILPESKLALLARLRAQGHRVAFVGDGINDAPALAEADVGIAIGTGTDVAIESADVVLMSGDLRNVANAIALSKATMRNIAQNLFWAFAYNAALVPVAAGILYPVFGFRLSPVLGAGAMALSSVFVLTNALRLRGFRPILDGSKTR